jgi:flagellar biosynthesis protein FliR
MEILNLLPGLYEKFLIFLLIFTRISALLTTFVLFRREMVTSRMIISLSVILSLYVLMDANQQLYIADMFSLTMFIQEIFQILIGFLAGLVLNIVFEIFVGIGQIVSTQIGLSMASLIDLRFGYITSLTHFYVILGTIVFLSLNGHLFAIKLIMDSFSIIPLTYQGVPGGIFLGIANYASVIFSGSIMLCITVIVVIMTTNIAIAIMSKFAPQFNLFTIGINIQLIIGLLCIYITFYMLVNREFSFINDGFNVIQLLFTKMK